MGFCRDFIHNKPKKIIWDLFENNKVNNQLLIGGGVHPTLDKENTFKELPEFDGICVGEGEIPLLNLCNRIDNNQNILETPSFIFKKIDDSGKTSFKTNPVS